MSDKLIPIGDPFPTVEVQTTEGKIVLPNHFIDKWFILFSFPADHTPICQTEFFTFQKAYVQFRNLNCELIGLCHNQDNSFINWLDWIKDGSKTVIEFPVISDIRSYYGRTVIMVAYSKGVRSFSDDRIDFRVFDETVA